MDTKKDLIINEHIENINNISDTNVGDTISKQVAIDALEEGFKDVTEGVNKLSPTYELIKAVTGIYKCLIGKLPPAQPEIIRCKDCKYEILDCDFPHERYCDFKGNEWNNDNHFCGHAKRREVTK